MLSYACRGSTWHSEASALTRLAALLHSTRRVGSLHEWDEENMKQFGVLNYASSWLTTRHFSLFNFVLLAFFSDLIVRDNRSEKISKRVYRAHYRRWFCCLSFCQPEKSYERHFGSRLLSQSLLTRGLLPRKTTRSLFLSIKLETCIDEYIKVFSLRSMPSWQTSGCKKKTQSSPQISRMEREAEGSGRKLLPRNLLIYRPEAHHCLLFVYRK